MITAQKINETKKNTHILDFSMDSDKLTIFWNTSSDDSLTSSAPFSPKEIIYISWNLIKNGYFNRGYKCKIH